MWRVYSRERVRAKLRLLKSTKHFIPTFSSVILDRSGGTAEESKAKGRQSEGRGHCSGLVVVTSVQLCSCDGKGGRQSTSGGQDAPGGDMKMPYSRTPVCCHTFLSLCVHTHSVLESNYHHFRQAHICVPKDQLKATNSVYIQVTESCTSAFTFSVFNFFSCLRPDKHP